MRQASDRHTLLIGWDAADWKVIEPLMDAGKMPNLQRFVASGVKGQIATLHPPISPMLWTSIATGKRPFKHGIHGFSEPTPDGGGVQPVTNLSRRSKALWNILSQNDLRSVVIGWWPSHPVEPIKGVMVSDRFHRAGKPLEQGWPLLPHAIHPPELLETLAALRVHPDELTPEMVEPFIPRAQEIDQDTDKRLALFLRTLAECKSMHAAALWLLDHQPWDFFAVYYDAIDHFCHGFMKYHPPQQSWISGRDFEIYQNVVSMAYQFHDEMLGALLAQVGDETTVVLMSDHGFHPDHLRPTSIPDVPAGPTIEHRDFGIVVLKGPGIKKGGILHGASVLDLTPTILTLYGLPVGEDMDGKVLTSAFTNTPETIQIPSWEDVAGADGRHPAHMRLDPVAAQEALEQLVALGYIERPEPNREAYVDKTIRELRYNLAESYQDAARHFDAHRILKELYADDPNEQRFAVSRFVSSQALGMLGEMRQIVNDLESRSCEAPVIDYLEAQILVAEKRYPEALDAFGRVTQAHLVRPGLFLQTADLYERLCRWDEARLVYETALETDPDSVAAHLGLCRVALQRKQFHAAAQSALNAIERISHDPQAHFLLGRALAGMKEHERAAEAFRAAISCNPNFPEAHVRLAQLLEEHLGDVESASQHRALARRMRRDKVGTLPDSTPSQFDSSAPPLPLNAEDMPPLEQSLIVVTGLPRSGTSMLMQMLAAGGLRVLFDGLREPDADNPRGYFEFEPVKNLLNNSKWLLEARGNVVKIVAPLMTALPAGLPCRVILIERDVEEVLDSQEQMLVRRNQPLAATPARRSLLKEEYLRALDRMKAMLSRRPQTRLLVVEHRQVISDSRGAAVIINEFLESKLDVDQMAAAIDPALHRNRTSSR